MFGGICILDRMSLIGHINICERVRCRGEIPELRENGNGTFFACHGVEEGRL